MNIYADDISIVFAGNNIHEYNSTMKSLEEWSSANLMRINANKTKSVTFKP